MKVVYVIGAFRGKTAWEIAENVRAAERVGLEVARLGAMPVIPHANTAHFHGSLPDEFWLEGTLELAARCDSAITTTEEEWRKSTGSVGEVGRMKKSGRPVFHRLDDLRAWLAGASAQGARSGKSGPGAGEEGPRVEVASRLTPWPTSREQDMVAEFHERMGCARSPVPAVVAAELRARLVEEEARELADALRAGDLVEAVDGMCDLMYVTLGTAVACGVPLGRFFEEVHRTNMLKLDGPRRADGKVMKPAGWRPPRIRELLALLRGEVRLPREGDRVWTRSFDTDEFSDEYLDYPVELSSGDGFSVRYAENSTCYFRYEDYELGWWWEDPTVPALARGDAVWVGYGRGADGPVHEAEVAEVELGEGFDVVLRNMGTNVSHTDYRKFSEYRRSWWRTDPRTATAGRMTVPAGG